MATKTKKPTAAQTLEEVLQQLDLPANATSADIMAAIAAKAAVRERVPAWTPTVTQDGEVRFAGTRVRLAADQLPILADILTSKDFKEFLEANADKVLPRAEVRKARKARREAAKAAKAAKG